jgi:hypothetical protein
MYKLDPNLTKDKLNDFYNTVFRSFGEWAERDKCKVIMFSDSLLIYGSNLQQALEELGSIYVKLLRRGILLRGAMVYGKLAFEPRYTLDNFQKMLPEDDTLARVVGLAGTQKGVRLIMESDVARKLLEDHVSWLTHDGYLRAVNNSVSMSSILRRICPTPDNDSYELLYYWATDNSDPTSRGSMKQLRAELEEMKKMLREDIAEQYKETIGLLTRCEARRKYTEKAMGKLLDVD